MSKHSFSQSIYCFRTLLHKKNHKVAFLWNPWDCVRIMLLKGPPYRQIAGIQIFVRLQQERDSRTVCGRYVQSPLLVNELVGPLLRGDIYAVLGTDPNKVQNSLLVNKLHLKSGEIQGFYSVCSSVWHAQSVLITAFVKWKLV